MDCLPVELLRLILSYCDPASVRSLRLVTPTLADLGYDYLLSPVFVARPWRDDVARLRAIADHDRLRSRIASVVFAFAGGKTAGVSPTYHNDDDDHDHDDPRGGVDNWMQQPKQQQRLLPPPLPSSILLPLHAHDPVDVAAALRPLVNLRHVSVAFTHVPSESKGEDDVVGLRRDKLEHHVDAGKTLNVLMAALQLATAPGGAVTPPPPPPPPLLPLLPHNNPPGGGGLSLESLAIDRLPLELFRQSCDRRLWFGCGDVFAGLRRLALVLDPSQLALPASQFKAINGLGYVLRRAPHLTHLALAFRNHARPRDKFLLSFREVWGEGGMQMGRKTRSHHHHHHHHADTFGYAGLTDFHLEGVACDERELRAFLLRHAATLERLRLGGRGLVRGPGDPSRGGLRLFNGTFRSLFRSLHGDGRLPRLQRLHLEGDFDCAVEALSPVASGLAPTMPTTTTNYGGGGGPGMLSSARTRHERYLFWATTDDDWSPASEVRAGVRLPRSITSQAFEAYLLGATHEYPGRVQD